MDLILEGAPKHVPDFLIGGAARGGTTTLYSYLKNSTGVFMSPEKEPHFLLVWNEQPYYKDDRGRYVADYISYTLEDYLRQFASARAGDLIGEASSWYLYGGERMIANTRRLYGNQARRLKIILVLRSPVDRAWSHFWLKTNRGEEHLSFAQAVRPEVVKERLARRCSPAFDYLGMSLYSRNVEAFLGSFDAVKVLLFDDFRRDNAGTLAGIYGFLGLAVPDPFPNVKRLNTTGVPRNLGAMAVARLTYQPNALKAVLKHLIPRAYRRRVKNRLGSRLFRPPVMDPVLRRELTGFFRPDVLRLEKVIGRDLGAWLEEPSIPEHGQPDWSG